MTLGVAFYSGMALSSGPGRPNGGLLVLRFSCVVFLCVFAPGFWPSARSVEPCDIFFANHMEGRGCTQRNPEGYKNPVSPKLISDLDPIVANRKSDHPGHSVGNQSSS